MITNYVLLSANRKYGINLNQLLAHHLLKYGKMNDNNLLGVDFDALVNDIRTNLTFVIFYHPEQALKGIDAIIKNQPLPKNSILGVSNIEEIALDKDHVLNTDAIQKGYQKTERQRVEDRIINKQSSEEDIYKSMIFAPAPNLMEKLDMENIYQGIEMIQKQVQEDLTSYKYVMINSYRENIQPFTDEKSKFEEMDYKEQERRQQEIINLDAVERTRLNSFERGLYDRYEFEHELQKGVETAFTVYEIK